MALTGENFKRINRNSTIKYLREEVQQARETFWNYMKKIGWVYDDKASKLEKEIELAEHNLYCAEYEDNRRRTWQ
jgi:hypothetical protein